MRLQRLAQWPPPIGTRLRISLRCQTRGPSERELVWGSGGVRIQCPGPCYENCTPTIAAIWTVTDA